MTLNRLQDESLIKLVRWFLRLLLEVGMGPIPRMG